MKVVTTDQMQELERRSAKHGIQSDTLMENAGLAVARKAQTLLQQSHGARVLVLVGPGNNGGDGLVAARHLYAWGMRVTLYMCTTRRGEQSKFELCQSRRISILEGDEDPHQTSLKHLLSNTDIVVDAILGTGGMRPIEGNIKKILQTVHQAKAHRPTLIILAIDLPTGMNANTGQVDQLCLYANSTITLGAPKTGLFAFPGANHVGRLDIADINIPAGLDKDIDLELLDDNLINQLLPTRPLDAHKGTFGHVLIVAGSRHFVGAATLASVGAYRSGAGLVTLATPENVYPLVASQLIETTFLPLECTPDGLVAPQAAEVVRNAMSNASVLLVGCGLGQGDSVKEFLSHLLLTKPFPELPVVIDADAINNLTKIYQRRDLLHADAVLTPHPGEMGRMLGKDISEIQKERVAMAQDAAHEWGHTVVLKGAFTVIATPNGPTRLSPFANPSLSSGGTGDVLSGVIAGLISQGLSTFDAASCGVYVHSLAAEQLRKKFGDAGMVASDLLPQIPITLKAIRSNFC